MSNPRRAACAVCHRTFASAAAAAMHRRDTHRGDTNTHKCRGCTRTFATATAAAAHHRDVHTYKCDACDRVFTTHQGLAAHTAALHDDDWRPSDDDEGMGGRLATVYHECMQCERAFDTARGLAEHTRVKHRDTARAPRRVPPLDRLGPPFHGADGWWMLPEDVSTTKSFGWYRCHRCSGQPRWISAHAFKVHYTQACKACNTPVRPFAMWQNADDSRKDRGDDDLEGDPHRSDLCSACAAGACRKGATKFAYMYF